MVNISNKTSDISHTSDFCSVVEILSGLNHKFEKERLLNWYFGAKLKARTRTSVTFDSGDQFGLSINKNNLIFAYYNTADLSLLDDFDELKLKLDIVNKSFVTISRPLRFDTANVYVRDTILLAPAGLSSLHAIGKLYSNEGDYNKIEVKKQKTKKVAAILLKFVIF